MEAPFSGPLLLGGVYNWMGVGAHEAKLRLHRRLGLRGLPRVVEATGRPSTLSPHRRLGLGGLLVGGFLWFRRVAMRVI